MTKFGHSELLDPCERGSAVGDLLFPDFSNIPVGWNLTTGEGLDTNGLAAWHDQLALLQLVEAAQRENEFWEQVDRVRAGATAHKIAAAYGSRGRRRLFATLLSTAAAERSRRTAALRLVNVTPAAWMVDETPRAHYKNRPEFLEALHEGAQALARRGASKCLSCGIPVRQDEIVRRRVRRDYCHRCRAGESDYTREKRLDRIEVTVASALRALDRVHRGPGTSDESIALSPEAVTPPARRSTDCDDPRRPEYWTRERRDADSAERAASGTGLSELDRALARVWCPNPA